jgi:hypothetical protein
MSLPLHVNFHEGGQAIVGHVEHQGRVVNLALGPSLECAILSSLVDREHLRSVCVSRGLADHTHKQALAR